RTIVDHVIAIPFVYLLFYLSFRFAISDRNDNRLYSSPRFLKDMVLRHLAFWTPVNGVLYGLLPQTWVPKIPYITVVLVFIYSVWLAKIAHSKIPNKEESAA